MKPKTNFTLFLPDSVRKVIDLYFTRNRDAYYYIVHCILLKALQNGNKTNKFFPVNMAKIEKIIRRRPVPLLKDLKDVNIIQNDGSYMPHLKSLHYRVNPKLLLASDFFVVTPQSYIYNQLNGLYTKKNTNRDLKKSYLKIMYSHFLKLKFDCMSAIKFTNTAEITNDKRCAYLYSIELLKSKNTRYFKRNKTNTRLDTNLTNLYKPLRKFIIGSDNLISIDLRNSQPLFLTILILETTKMINYKHQGETLPLCFTFPLSDFLSCLDNSVIRDFYKFFNFADFNVFEEFINFANLTFSGTLYSYMLNLFGNRYSKDRIKEIMFEIFYSKNIIQRKNKGFIPYARSKRLFASAFPNVYKIVHLLKQKSNSDLANMLSKMEAYVMIDIICEKLVSNDIVPLTIHDSIIVDKKDAAEAYKIIAETFLTLFDRVPSFSIETIAGEKLSDTDLHHILNFAQNSNAKNANMPI
ncbi:MAG: hypothetical protein PHY08_07685 [Candidatus Cloacimonetes bacterium]|nr:hypothetical protein [Candidatus Cloacimonadota bacterium]